MKSTIIDGVKYPIIANLSPKGMLDGYKLGPDKWKKQYPKGNYELLSSTVKSLFKKKVVVTTQGKTFIYFDINNIPSAFKDDFPNDLLDFIEQEKID